MDAAVGPSSVLLAGGGSAGHVSPLLAVADALRRRDPAVKVTALGTATGLEARLVPARGYELRFVPRVPLPRRPDPALLRLPGALRGAVTAARTAIDESGAEVVVGFGGYVSTPAYLAARQRRIPIVVHEQNARAGLANRVGSRMTPFVATTFRATVLPNASVLGMPLRREVSQLDRAARRQEGMAAFGLDPQWPTLLVTGGSLGAQRLNVSFAERAAELSAAGVQVLHVTGAGKEFEPERPGVGAPYVVIPYADRMELAYAAADLVVCRAGANTVCELTAVGLPAVYVPLPIGNGEQRFNAADVLAVAGGLIVDDASFTPEWITDNVLPLATDGGRLRSMGEAAASVGQRDADEALAEMIYRAYAARSSGRASSSGRPGESR
ncbi:MAG TPA: undecaprenyldiphospho-muramoylpentapeptide beta-N-acetylglucosaminyltransferase [Lapillicoccus sp.]